MQLNWGKTREIQRPRGQCVKTSSLLQYSGLFVRELNKRTAPKAASFMGSLAQLCKRESSSKHSVPPTCSALKYPTHPSASASTADGCTRLLAAHTTIHTNLRSPSRCERAW